MIEGKCLQNLTSAKNVEKNYEVFDSTLHNLPSDLQPLEMQKDCSPYKSPAVLSFDAYGNLTSSDDPDAPYTHEVPSLAEFNDILNSFEAKSPLSTVNELSQCAGKNNGAIKKNKSKKIKNNSSTSEPTSLSDKDLKQAFKKDFDSTSLSVTSRYGRTRKRKAQDGFLFGTINFNELRKITSTSPKKNRHSSSESKSDSESVEFDEVHTAVAKSFEVLAEKKSGYSSEEEFVSEIKHKKMLKSKKKYSPVHTSNNIDQSTNNPETRVQKGKESLGNHNLIQDKESLKGSSKKKANVKSKVLKAKKGLLKSLNKKEKKKINSNMKKEKTPKKVNLNKINNSSKKDKQTSKSNNNPDEKIVKTSSTKKKVYLKNNNSNLKKKERETVKLKVKKDNENRKKTSLNKKKKREGWKTRPNKRKLEESEDTVQPKIKARNIDEAIMKESEDLPLSENNSSLNISNSEVNINSDESVPPVPSFNYWKNEIEELESIEEDVNIIKSSLATTDSPKCKITLQDSSNTKVMNGNASSTEKGNKETTTVIEKPKIVEMETLNEDLKSEEHLKTKSGRPVKKPEIIDFSISNKKCKEDSEKLKVSVIKEELLENTSEHNLKCESKHPCLYLIGDLVWVNMRGYPFWPGIIIHPKNETQYTRFKHTMGRKLKSIRQYHIQFFFDNHQTMWVNSLNIMPYDGLPKLMDYLEEVKTSIKNGGKVKRNSASSKFFMKAYNRILGYIQKEKAPVPKKQKWDNAIDEANHAVTLERYERIQHFQAPEATTKISKKISKMTETKSGKSVTELNSKTETNYVKGKSSDDFSGFDEDSSSCDKKKAKRLKLEAKLKPGDFEVYLQKHLDSTIDDLNLSKEKAKVLLQKKWKKLTPVQKSRYKSKRYYDPLSSTADTDDSSSDLSSVSSIRSKRSVNDDDGIEPSRGTYRVPKNEKICIICEAASVKTGGIDMIKCKGPCGSLFHLVCVGLNTAPTSEFKCAECLSGLHKCFVCKNDEGEVSKCSVPSCGKFYHDSCVRAWPQVSKARQTEKLICPRHVCHMCAANSDDMSDPAAKTPPFTRCLRCPTTYHTGEACIAAGAEEISQNSHICTKHMKTPKNNSHHFNVNWCFCCSKGGSLLLCDQCPAAFHAECLNITAPDGGYVCDDCENGKFPVYGDIVWVKLGTYRWWPGEVLHPRYIPDNIENLHHVQGMFCVRFFGTDDYYWLSRGRTFHYQEGDQGSKKNANTFLELKFKKALEEAVIAYNVHKERRLLQEQSRSLKGNMKPPPYVKIDTNRPVGSVRLTKLDPSSVTKCDCDPYSENPCGLDDKCINRMLMVECIKEICGAKERCKNQRFQRRQYPNVFSFKTSGGRGWGLKTKDFIKKGDFVIEYVGELIDETEFRRRIDEMHEHKEQNYYFLTVETDRMIDAGPKGNLARFMNHSCQPNCETQKWTVGADTRVGLFALEDIPEGSELTFNYNLECVGTDKKKCDCGAPNCSGFIGAKVQKAETSNMKNSLSKRKKKGRKKKNAKDTENECFRCGSDGDLILCDIAVCPKGYHLECLGLEDLPKGKWICPWHHCDECGVRSSTRCMMCPNSYCRLHSNGKFHVTPGLGNVCLEHGSEDLETLRGQMKVEMNCHQAENTAQKYQLEEKEKEESIPQDIGMKCISVQGLPQSSSLVNQNYAIKTDRLNASENVEKQMSELEVAVLSNSPEENIIAPSILNRNESGKGVLKSVNNTVTNYLRSAYNIHKSDADKMKRHKHSKSVPTNSSVFRLIGSVTRSKSVSHLECSKENSR